ncbi:uncharacterized protein LOC119766301 [Culex quinquefasciatus]|uniref:uncharacterized protein LOC119766301 n=1 Tax=Culex quinquefasciatus TaxID=7176 RepID=UPI0018E3C063|nr:uncharacterized protein LOC119766301 [Culex quinquefasciatus]
MAPTTKKASPTLKQLEAKLRSSDELFHAVYAFASEMNNTTTLSQVKVRLEKLDGLWEKVNDTILDIEMHEDYAGTDDAYSKMRKDCLQCYYDTKTLLVDKVKELETYPELNTTQRDLNVTQHPIHDHVRLPQIQLQKFDGKLDEWLSFRDLYTSLIHWKKDLPDIEKFQYLKGCLLGKPRTMVDGLYMSAKNYQVAWDILTKYYNDNNLLKRSQVETLFNLPTLTEESVTDIQELLEGFERAVRTLDQFVSPEDYKDLLLLHLLSSRLDPVTKRSWEEVTAAKANKENKESNEPKEKETVKDLTDFLYTRIRVLSSLKTMTAGTKADTKPSKQRKAPFTRSSYNAVQSPRISCVVCSEPHLLYRCPTFQGMSVAARDKVVRTNSMCLNCFRRGHQATQCTSRFVCQNCSAKHHTLVCFKPKRSDRPKSMSSGQDNNRGGNNGPNGGSSYQAAQSSTQTETVTSNVAAHRTSTVLLATAVVLVEDDEGVKFPARALLDSGSECNFMTERLCQRLKVQRKRSNVAVYGIGQANTKVKHKIQATIKSRVTGFSRRMEFLLLPKVTANLPTSDVSVAGWEFPPDVELADPAFFNSKTVDIVLGIHHFFAFFNSGKELELGVGLPTLTETVFGWIVTGNVENQDSNSVTQCNVAVSSTLEELLTRFWACEEVATPHNYSPAETRCEELYSRTVKRGPDGRYTVSYPKDEDALARMGESRDIAFRRLQGLERRLEKDPDLRRQYNQFMEEYLELGHMREATDLGEVKRVFLPHHPVVRESSTTTKVRVVFDASCASSTGVSLNDALLVGPSIQDDLRSIILRSRTKQFMLVSDMEKMFRQVLVTEEDMKLQSIMWRDDPNKVVKVYELATVTYGTKPAPFLATRTLKQLAMDEQSRFPMAAKVALEDVYMDDVLTGADDEDQAVELRTQLDALLKSGGFRLRKWASNSPLVLQGIPDENLALSRTGDVLLDPDPSVRTLGLVWRPTTDVLKFQFDHPIPNPNQPWTRRRIMSTIATLFDPIGFVGPVIAAAKILMQKLRTLEDTNGKKLDWDDELPPAIVQKWLKFYEQIPVLNDLTFPRCVIIPKAVNIEIHTFCDASQDAYGACSYVRSVNQDGEVRVALLSSKSKVAPLKCQSICGAELAALLSEQIFKATKLDVKYYYWTDSTCVLQWLRHVPTTWNTFVANRLAKIQALTERGGWNHVPGVQNPADLISRGVAPADIADLLLWWEGPPWLKLSPEHWPSQPVLDRDEEADQERRHVAANLAGGQQIDFPSFIISKFSNYWSLIRSVAYWSRLMKILRHEEGVDQRGLPTARELKEAEHTMIRLVQKEEFKAEWQALSNGESVGRNSPLRWFNPKLADDNLIRVGGRLGHSQETDSTKHDSFTRSAPADQDAVRGLPRTFTSRGTAADARDSSTQVLAAWRSKRSTPDRAQLPALLPDNPDPTPTELSSTGKDQPNRNF